MHFTRYFIIGLILSIITLAGCQKNGGGSKEENLVVETSPAANGQLETPSPEQDFPLRVTIKSAMPAGGVKIDITGKPDGGGAFFTVSKSTTTAINDFTITGTPSRVVSVIEITVTSNITSSNRWTGTYKYSRK